MRHPNRRSFAIGQLLALMVAALAFTTPASAQFGALKKKLKGEAAQKAVEKAAGEAGADAPAAPGAPSETGAAPAGGGTIVLTPEVVDRYLAALKARVATREAAKKEDTPYANYLRAKAAYDVAKPKCEAAYQPGLQRLAADQKKMDKYSAMTEKLAAAQGRQDQAAAQIYADSAMAIVDPSCGVHQPEQPKDWYDMQRQVEDRAQEAALKTADMSQREFGQTGDNVTAILTGNGPMTNTSPSEKAAVNAKSAELKDLMGLREAQEGRVSKTGAAPAPAPVADTAPTPAPVQAPRMPPGAAAMNDCMVKNIQKHEAEIKALGDRGEAAKDAGNTPLMMAIADTIQRIQMAGCARGY